MMDYSDLLGLSAKDWETWGEGTYCRADISWEKRRHYAFQNLWTAENGLMHDGELMNLCERPMKCGVLPVR